MGETVQKQLKKPFPLEKRAQCCARRGTKAAEEWHSPGETQDIKGRCGPSAVSGCFSVHLKQGDFCTENKAPPLLSAGRGGTGCDNHGPGMEEGVLTFPQPLGEAGVEPQLHPATPVQAHPRQGLSLHGTPTSWPQISTQKQK